MLPTLRRLTACGLFLAAASIYGPLASRTAQAQPPSRYTYRNDLFYNYYVGPARFAGGVPAQMYLSPRPTPPLVGHTYITYQPFLPHEYLYEHNRVYRSAWDGGGRTTTRVSYRRGPFWNYPFGRGPRVISNSVGRNATPFGDRHFVIPTQPFSHYLTPMYGKYWLR